MSAPEGTARMRRQTTLGRLLRMRRGPWEGVATIVIALGVLMLMQPLTISLYGYSFVTILAGTVMFVIVSHFPD